MCVTTVCLATVLLGVDVGWLPLSEGGLEYRIQIEPELLENFDGREVLAASDVPPNLKDIRAFRITVGTAELVRSPALDAEEALPDVPVAPADPFMPSPSSPALPAAGPLNRLTPGTLTPGPLPDDPISRPIEVHQASHIASMTPEPSAKMATDRPALPQVPPKPWGTLIATLFALFASCGLNIYLGWIAVDFRQRYRMLAEGPAAKTPID